MVDMFPTSWIVRQQIGNVGWTQGQVVVSCLYQHNQYGNTLEANDQVKFVGVYGEGKTILKWYNSNHIQQCGVMVISR